MRQITFGLAAFALGTMVVGTVLAYQIAGPLPDPGPAPSPPEKATLATYRYLPTFFRALIEDDAESTGTARLTVEALARGNRAAVELDRTRALRVGHAVQTASLSLRLVRRKLWVGEEGRRFRLHHLILRITNRTQKYLAYRVTTQVTGNCSVKSVLAQNALAIRPRQTLERTECLARGARATLERVEVMVLPGLGYHYVSRLEPSALQLPTRTAAGHMPAKLTECRLLPWNTLKSAFETGNCDWRDVVDFYSRHNCDEYSFPAGYRWSAAGPGLIPVRAP